MPFELLEQNVVSATLEIVRRAAKQRRWKASTWAKELASYAGALRDLPLYNRERGIVLNNYPEWRAAVKMVKRLEREMEPDPPEPVDFAQCQRAIFELRQSSPRAALFLSMMWALASRAGDIASLRQKDVTLSTTVREDGMVALGIEQKYGKGTRFRGTYWPASTLQPEEASELRKHLGQNESDLGSMKLFPDQELLRQQIRAALKRQNRECALPSVRKGAIRHLARQGLTEDALMRLTGHKRVETLYRYLGRGLPVTQEAVAAQAAASLVHRPLPRN
eukprot:gene13500-biopygen9801